MSIETIETEIERIKTINATNMNESTAKTSFIFPMLRALGWDTTDPDEVQQEYRVGGHMRGHADIALFSGGKPCVLIETKAPTKAMDVDHQGYYKMLKQLKDYCKIAEVSLGVLSNGKEWHIYYFDKNSSMEELPLAEVINIDEADTRDCGSKLWKLLSRDKVSDNGAQTLAEKVWIQRLMVAKWKELMTSDNKALASLLRSSIRKSTGINVPLEDVKKFLKERAAIPSSPAVSADVDGTSPPDTGTPSADPDTPKRRRSNKAIKPRPTHIQIRGQRYEAKSWREGLITFFDEAYRHDPATFTSNLISTPYKGSRRTIGIYQDSEKAEMSHLPGQVPTPIADSNLYLYVNASSETIQESIREVRELLGWREDSVQFFRGDQLLYPDG